MIRYAILLACTVLSLSAGQPLLDVDPRGGRVLRIPGFDLRLSGANFGSSGNPAADQGESGTVQSSSQGLSYQRGEDGIGYYMLDRSLTSLQTMTLIPNRSYILSVLINADVDRNRTNGTTEINLGLRTYDGGGKNVIDNLNGAPLATAGWQRWEWEFTTDPRTTHGRFHANVYDLPKEGHVWIADAALVELPPKPMPIYGRGEGVTFQGGPGNLPMRIERVESTPQAIRVRTTGALYTFDLATETITARQLIEQERDLAIWKSSLTLKGLAILSQTSTEVVLGNDNLTLGVQCDSLVMVVPHNDLVLTLTSRIGGEWNRLAAGHLFVRDGYGGMTVNPDIPLGSGRPARLDANVRPGRVVSGELDFSGRSDDQVFLSQAKPGWSIKWYLSPGERIGISTFPPRLYPWKESFEGSFFITRSSTPVERYAKWSRYARAGIMWDFFRRSWGGSQGGKFLLRNEAEFRRHVAALKQAGIHRAPYLSPYFYSNRNPVEFAAEARRIRDTYDVDGAYYDGIPSQEWVSAYETMRMTREIFKDGVIIYHNTGHASNGTAPLGEPSMKIPAIETYANFTYAGELVYGYGKDWAYPKYIASQYRMANCIGTMKSSQWAGLTPTQRDLMLLLHNGRASLLPQDRESPSDQARQDQFQIYWGILSELRKTWEQNGNAANFFETYYLPKAKELSKGVLPE